jgi:ABC-type antimicrobial peptide transport system permease subunit
LEIVRLRGFGFVVVFKYFFFVKLFPVFCGTIIGLIVGYTLTAQQILFTQYELTFWFPWEVILVVVGLSIVFAFLASIVPIMMLTRLPVVVILRKLVT